MYTYYEGDMQVPLKVFSTKGSIEEQCITQMENVSSLPFLVDHTALMPDGHLGVGASIGSVVACDGYIIPSLVGVDIGCGMLSVRTNLMDISIESIKKIMSLIRDRIPVGFEHNKFKISWIGFDNIPNIKIIKDEIESSKYQLSSLGGGNHFWELQKGSDGFIYFMIHSGSRNFGLQIAKYYQNIAKELCEKWHSNIPDEDLAFLPMNFDIGMEYFKAMNFALEFAKENRKQMAEKTMEAITEIIPDVNFFDELDIHHNYAAIERHYGKDVIIHRKGATSAKLGELGIIPGSQGTSSYIVIGKGNRESFYSCSHGSGRKMGRKQAKKQLNLKDEQKLLDDQGILHSVRNLDSLDEATGAYKDIEEVMNNQKELVDIKIKLKPLAVIKG